MNSTPYSQSNLDRHSQDNLERQRQRLEALVQAPGSRFHRLQTWGQRVLSALTAHNGPRIRQRMVQGQIQWVAYDPITQQRHVFITEQDLRVWLEGRYYD
ncbi:MAG: hypothetical protein ACHWZW_10695 [Spirulina sp.]